MEININGNVTINNYSVNVNSGTNWNPNEKEGFESSQMDEESINPEEVTAPTKFAEQLIDENATLNELLLALAANPDAQNAAVNEVANKEDERKVNELRAKFGEDVDLIFDNKSELQKQKRRPGAIQLRLNYICIAFAEGAGSGVCEVYSNGYAVYDNGNRRTVIWVPDCSTTTYYFGKLRDKEKEYLKEKVVIGEDILGVCPWRTALIIAGENCIESNMNHPKSKGTTSDYDTADLDIPPATHWVGASHFDTPEAAYLKKEAAEARSKVLTAKQLEIFELYFAGGMSMRYIADRYGVHFTTISEQIAAIKNRMKSAPEKYVSIL